MKKLIELWKWWNFDRKMRKVANAEVCRITLVDFDENGNEYVIEEIGGWGDYE